MTPSSDLPLLVLDLDETIIYSTDEVISGLQVFRSSGYHVHARPHLTPFLNSVALHYRVAVWTAASMPYAIDIVRETFPKDLTPAFIWAYERCTLKRDFDEDAWIATKPLVKIKRSRGIPLERILIVEDDPLKVRCNYGNAVYVKPFQGNPSDNELKHLTEYLRELATEDDFRRVEKRGWRQKYDRND